MADLKELYDYVDAHAQEYIELLQKFCRQPSISAQNLGIREMVDMIQALRTYQANAAAVEMNKGILKKALEISKN